MTGAGVHDGAPPGFALRFGPWWLGEVLGVGRYGEVRRARWAAQGDGDGAVVGAIVGDVALKRLLPMWAVEPASRRDFEAEIRAASRVRGPRVARVVASGVARGLPWLALELVEGRRLARLLRAGPLGVREAAAVTHDLALGLASCHAAGVLHGDLAPSNALVDRRGWTTLVDFGVATVRAADGHEPLENEALVEVPGSSRKASAVELPGDARGAVGRAKARLGTPAFVDPEAAAGVPREPGSDVASLGMLWVRMRAGASPLGPGPAAEQRRRAAARQFDDALIARALAELPRRPAALLRAAFAPLPERPTAHALAEGLATLLDAGDGRPAIGRRELGRRVASLPASASQLYEAAEDRGELVTGEDDTTATRIASPAHQNRAISPESQAEPPSESHHNGDPYALD